MSETWQQELERMVQSILKDNPKRVVPVTRSEAILIWTMVDALGLVPEWVDGSFDLDPDSGPLARCHDVIQRVLEGHMPT
jgi:hypothetical protein